MGNALINEIYRIVYVIQYAKFVKEYFKINNEINVYCKKLDRKIFQLCINEILKIENINFVNKYEMFFWEKIKIYGTICLLLSLPFVFFFKSKNKKKLKLKDYYKAIVHLDPGFNLKNEPMLNLFTDGSNFEKNELLFVVDVYFDKKWEEEIKKSDYKILNFKNDLIQDIGKIEFLTKYFKSMIYNSLNLCQIVYNNAWLAAQLYQHLKQKYLWEIFFDATNISNSYRVMSKGDLTSAVMLKKEILKLIFFTSQQQVK